MEFKTGQLVCIYRNHKVYTNSYHITTFNGVVVDTRNNSQKFMDLRLDDGKMHPVYCVDIRPRNYQLLFNFMLGELDD